MCHSSPTCGALLEVVGCCASRVGWIADRRGSGKAHKSTGTYEPAHKHPGFVGMGYLQMHSERADTTGEKKTNLTVWRQMESAQEKKKWEPEDLTEKSARKDFREHALKHREQLPVPRGCSRWVERQAMGKGLEQYSSQSTKDLQLQPTINNRWFDTRTGGQDQRTADTAPCLSRLA